MAALRTLLALPDVLRHATAFTTNLLLLLFYIAIGGVVMSYGQGLSLNESVYFMMVTMSTVGYGDIAPETPGLKTFIVFWQILGLFLFVRVSSLVVTFTKFTDAKGQMLLEWLFPPVYIDVDGDGTADFRLPDKSAAWFYTKNLLPQVLTMVLIQLVAAWVFFLVEPEWEFGDGAAPSELALFACAGVLSLLVRRTRARSVLSLYGDGDDGRVR
jgi:hypothetical protein